MSERTCQFTLRPDDWATGGIWGPCVKPVVGVYVTSDDRQHAIYGCADCLTYAASEGDGDVYRK